MLFITLLSCCSFYIIPPSSHRKFFAGHRFSTHFLHTQIFILALSARSEEQTSSPEIWAKCSLSNVLCSLSNVLCCLPQLQSLRSILSKNNSKTFWCRQPATLLKPTPSQDLPVELCERFQNSYSVGLLVLLSQLPEAHTFILGNQIFFSLYAFSQTRLFRLTQLINRNNLAKQLQGPIETSST